MITEAYEVAEGIADGKTLSELRELRTPGAALAMVRTEMPDESLTIVNAVACELYRLAALRAVNL